MEFPRWQSAAARKRCTRSSDPSWGPRNKLELRMKTLFFSVVALCVSAGMAYAENTINVLHVQGNVYMLVGAVGNIVVQVSSDGILVVDTGVAEKADQVVVAIK